MSDDRELIEIQQQMEEIMEKLGGMFTTDYPRWSDVYEDVGAAVYYIEEAGYHLKAVSKRLQPDLEL